jgi:hypothetical protein
LVSLLSVALFIVHCVPFLFRTCLENQERAALLSALQNDLVEVKSKVDPQHVVCIPPFSAVEWTDGYRYAFLPRGLTMSPRGIADYAVVVKKTPVSLSAYRAWDRQALERDLIEHFEVTASNEHFLLLHRVSVPGHDEEHRELFVHHFGRSSIGLE